MCNECGTGVEQGTTRRGVIKTGALGVAAIGAGVGVRGLLQVSASEEAPHWEYADEGEDGENSWGDIDPAYASCKDGREQSPIDLVNKDEVDIADIELAEETLSPLALVNNGHTIQVNATSTGGMTIDGKTYKLAQFHFHAPSEHTFDGLYAPLELHLVHKSDDGNLAVLGILIKEGAENAALAPVFANIPAEKTEEPVEVEGSLDVMALFPENKTTYRYNGSLTTPPCTEGVLWNVFVDTIEASREQIRAYTVVYSDTARQVQPLNERDYIKGK
jgi:carbonic anhydrase